MSAPLDSKRLGQAARNAHKLQDALKHYEDAVAIERKLDDPLAVAHTVRHVADILRELGVFDRSAAEYNDALRIYRAHPAANRLDLANAVAGFARLQTAIGDHQAARPLWEEAREIYAALEIQPGVDECDGHLRRA